MQRTRGFRNVLLPFCSGVKGILSDNGLGFTQRMQRSTAYLSGCLSIFLTHMDTLVQTAMDDTIASYHQYKTACLKRDALQRQYRPPSLTAPAGSTRQLQREVRYLYSLS